MKRILYSIMFLNFLCVSVNVFGMEKNEESNLKKDWSGFTAKNFYDKSQRLGNWLELQKKKGNKIPSESYLYNLYRAINGIDITQDGIIIRERPLAFSIGECLKYGLQAKKFSEKHEFYLGTFSQFVEANATKNVTNFAEYEWNTDIIDSLIVADENVRKLQLDTEFEICTKRINDELNVLREKMAREGAREFSELEQEFRDVLGKNLKEDRDRLMQDFMKNKKALETEFQKKEAALKKQQTKFEEKKHEMPKQTKKEDKNQFVTKTNAAILTIGMAVGAAAMWSIQKFFTA